MSNKKSKVKNSFIVETERQASIRSARARLLRNVAAAIHTAMYIANISEEKLVARSGISADRVRAILLAELPDARLDEVSTLATVCDCRLDLRIEPNEGGRLWP